MLAAAAVMAEIQALLLAAGIEPGVVARNENTVFREYPAHATRIATARGKLLDAMRSETEPIP